MNFYILQLSDSVKIGMSDSLENRISKYKNVTDSKFFHDLNGELCEYLEAATMDFFNSETEYIYNVEFNNIHAFIEQKIKTIITTFNFKPLNIEMILNSDGLYKVNSVMDHINEVRANKGKNQMFVADYIRLNQSVEFFDYIKYKTGNTPIIAKRGKYGGTYARAEVVLDILMWGDTTTKYNIMKWMYDSKKEYTTFLNPTIKHQVG